jgi:hypothetical protein
MPRFPLSSRLRNCFFVKGCDWTKCSARAANMVSKNVVANKLDREEVVIANKGNSPNQ